MNSTISGNEASTGQGGGGILNEGFASEQGGPALVGTVPAEAAGAFFENATIANNEALAGNGGGIRSRGSEEESGSLTARVGEDQPQALGRVPQHRSWRATAHRVRTTARATSPTDLTGSRPTATTSRTARPASSRTPATRTPIRTSGSSQDNGGPTDTQALAEGSPAIDAGDPDANKCEDADQRGVTRFQRDGCDMGAYEAGAVPQPPNEIPHDAAASRRRRRGAATSAPTGCRRSRHCARAG